MNKLVLFAIGISITIIIAGFFLLSNTQKRGGSQQQTSFDVPVDQELSMTDVEVFGTPKKSAHYESNTPAHTAILAAPPINVVIDFNFDLAKNSTISVQSGGKEYGAGETTIDSNRLSMRRNVDPASPDGRYTVTYNACWPDGSCHDGHFQFDIKRNYKKAWKYEDLRNKKEVTIKLSNITFNPKLIQISNGTKVNWINNDTVQHYINTDSHPAHTYYPTQNSKALKEGDTYSVIFTTPGEYPYHCSAHADTMAGSILVE